MRTKLPDTRLAPPVSLTEIWDKAKWHIESELFPPALSAKHGVLHIRAALRFLASKGQLTAEGKRDLRTALDEDLWLHPDQVKAAGRVYLDSAYSRYLKHVRYGKLPPVGILEESWETFLAKYDITKRVQPNAYQRLLKTCWEPTLDCILAQRYGSGKLKSPGDLIDLQTIKAQMPRRDRQKLAAVVCALGPDLKRRQSKFTQPLELLRALRFVADDFTRLKVAAAILRRKSRRQDGPELWSALAQGIRHGDGKHKDEVAAWQKLTTAEQKCLASAVNRLFEHSLETEDDDAYLDAIYAMRHVGDETSLELLQRTPSVKFEGSVGTLVRRKYVYRPVSYEARQEVAACVAARKKTRAAKK